MILKIIKGSDYHLITVTFILLAVSCLMVYSSAAMLSSEKYGSLSALFVRHLISVGIGLVLMFVVIAIPIRVVKRISPLMIGIGILMLGLVFVPGIGKSSGGAERWFQIFSLRFQPSEFVKLFIALYFASYISRHEHKMFRIGSGIIVPMFVVGVVSILLLLEPDFGSTVVIVGVVFAQLLMSSRLVHLFGLGIGALGALLLLAVAEPYRFRRIEAFLDPFRDPQNQGYQLIQSLIAVGSGGIFGKGLGAGEQKLFYLPAAHTDFIFAVIAEECGLVGALFVFFLFIYLGYRGFRLAYLLSHNSYLCSLAVGLTMLIIFPAMLNVGVVLGLLPTKGLVLPFISFGGTAMISNLLVLGMLISLSREVHDEFSFELDSEDLRSSVEIERSIYGVAN